LISHVHVIGDACIADAMPKSASAAYSQARQCASAIAALLAGREVPEPTFNSVCYSMLAPQSAISIHGRFDIQDGRIVAVESPAAPTAAAPTATVSATTTAGAQQAREAQRWYRSIRADSFAG